MSDALTKALLRRERLLMRIGHQRTEVAAAYARLERPAAMIDRLLVAGRFVREHPLALAVLAGALMALRAPSLSAMVARGLGLWQWFRSARALAAHFRR